MPTFSQRHYKFLAKVLQEFNNCPEKHGILEDFCNALANDNPKFNRNKFWKAATEESPK